LFVYILLPLNHNKQKIKAEGSFLKLLLISII
jgi:hypothetical protein